MKAKYFLMYGIIICLLFIFSGYNQWNIGNLFSPGKWGPKGPNSYHK